MGDPEQPMELPLQDSKSATAAPKSIHLVASVLIGIGLLTVLIYWAVVIAIKPVGIDQFGQAGDFFGGFLNPLLTFVTFLAVVYSIYVQTDELKESRIQFERSADALASQNSQNSFYSLLNLHNDIVSSFEAFDEATKKTRYGRDAFRALYSRMRRIYREKEKKFPKAPQDRLAQLAYGRIFLDEPQLATYFRYLFNTIVVIEKFPDSSSYIKLLRSTLSNQELLLLFYNTTCSEAGQNFREFAIKYKLFDNMPAHLFNDGHAKFIDSKAFGPGGYEAKKRQRGPGVTGDLRLT